MRNRYIIGFFVFSLVFIFLWGFPIIKKRYFSNNTKIINYSDSAEEEEKNVPNQESEKSENQTDNFTSIPISSSDCDNECEGFQDSEEKSRYCEEYCGISEIYDYGDEENEDEETDCDQKEGLKKDYCLKNLAIENEEMKICEQIGDDGIKKTCQNRLIEDFLENQN